MSDTQNQVTKLQPVLEVGAAVTWMHCSSNGRSIGFTTRRGKIFAINHENGMACAKSTRGKTQWLPVGRFRSASARTELTEMVADDNEQAANPEAHSILSQSGVAP